MHNLKLNALYVDIQNDKVIMPNKIIDKEQSYELIDLLRFINGFDIILDEDDEHLKKIVKLIDPQILSGTMKSNFHKYKTLNCKYIQNFIRFLLKQPLILD